MKSKIKQRPAPYTDRFNERRVLQLTIDYCLLTIDYFSLCPLCPLWLNIFDC